MFLRAINTLKVLSILAFLMMLLWIYAYLSEEVRFFLPGDPMHFVEMTKTRFFYIFLFTYGGINLFLYWFTFFIKGRAGIPNIIRSLKTDNKLNVLIGWLGGFHFSLNVLMLGILFYSGFHNINRQATPDQYSFFLIAGSIITFISLAGILVLMLRHTLSEK